MEAARPPLTVRAVLLVVLLLGAGLPPVGEVDEAAEKVVLEMQDGFWTQTAWDEAVSQGWDLLRLETWTRPVAWSDGTAHVPEGMHLLPAPPAVVPSLQPDDEVRLVFEPRLPVAAVTATEAHARSLGLPPIGLRTDAVTPQVVHHAWVPGMEHLQALMSVDKVLETSGRNDRGAGMLQGGTPEATGLWELGFNGTGTVLGTADSGIDLDHACFRHALSDVGEPGSEHRKVLAMNTSVHDADQPGQSDYRHGTHTAGTLVCAPVAWNGSTAPGIGTSLSHGARLVAADIVGPNGWAPPAFDALLAEAALNGAVVHSHSWGDDTTAYTARSGAVDLWSLEHPWSLAFIAPGNGGSVLEPANARNVVAVGATTFAQPTERWVGSPSGPTLADTAGIGLLAPGSSIVSAKADGLPESMNDEMRSSSGTSMATPMAASAAAVLQQMVQDGVFRNHTEATAEADLNESRPTWSSSNVEGMAHAGEGWVPSGALLRALLTLAATPLAPEQEGSGATGGLTNPQDGWGQPQLERLLAPEQNGTGVWDLTPHVWVHDAYRLSGTTPEGMLEERLEHAGSTSKLAEIPWDGSNGAGPFLAEGERFTATLPLIQGEGLEVRLAFPAAPEGSPVEDLLLIAVLDNGKTAVSGIAENGTSRLMVSNEVVLSEEHVPMSNETVRGIRLSPAQLSGATEVTIEVFARHVTPGNAAQHVGFDGGRTGFAVAAMGVVRGLPVDLDGDGVFADDACPEVPAGPLDQDRDGCPDDSDGDGVPDASDACPSQDASLADLDGDGCLDDADGDGVTDPIDRCPETPFGPAWPVNASGCRPEDRPLRLNAMPLADVLLPGDRLGIDVWLLDDDDDGALLEAMLSVDGLPMPETARGADGLGLHELRWDAEEWGAPWLRNGSLIEVHVSASSTNASPEASASVVLPDAPLRVAFLEPEPLPVAAERPASWPMVLAFLLGAAVWLTLTVFRRPPSAKEALRDPFVATSNPENEQE